MCAMEWEQVKDESINECGNVWQCKWTGDCNEWAMTTKPCEKSHQCAYSEEQESSTHAPQTIFTVLRVFIRMEHSFSTYVRQLRALNGKREME